MGFIDTFKKIWHDDSTSSSIYNNVGNNQYLNCTFNIIADQTSDHEMVHYGLEYLAEHISQCRNSLLEADFADFKSGLNALTSGDISSFPDDKKQTLYYYICLTGIIDSDIKKVDEYLGMLNKPSAIQIENLKTLKQGLNYNSDISSFKIGFSEFYPETQIVALLMFFNAGHYNDIYELYHDNINDTSFENGFRYFEGLSAFNQNDFEKAEKVLKSIKGRNKAKAEAFFILAGLHKYIRRTFDGDACVEDVTRKNSELQRLLDGYPDALKGNEQILAVTKLDAALATSPGDKKVFDEAYKSIDNNLKETEAIQVVLVQCLQHFNMYDEAAKTCEKLDWKNNVQIKILYTYSLLEDGQYQKVINICDTHGPYEDEIVKSRLETFRIIASSVVNHDKYKLDLADFLNNQHPPDDIVFLLLNVRTQDDYKIIEPSVKTHIDTFSSFSDRDKGIIASVCIMYHDYGDAIALLEKVDDFGKISLYSVLDICKYMFSELQNYSDGDRINYKPENSLHKIETIADIFIRRESNLKYFYQIKVICSQHLGKSTSALEYAVKLYKISPSPELCVNIIQFMCLRNDHDIHDYEPYTRAIEGSDNPVYEMALANAFMMTGDMDRAIEDAYKAVFFLDGKDDFNLYNSFISFSFRVLTSGYLSQVQIDKVKGNCVLILQGTEDDEIIRLCLDQESELKDYTENKSLEMSHLNRFSSNLYSRFLGDSVGQIHHINDKAYKLVSIDDKYIYTHRYVLKKATDNVDRVPMIIHSIKGNSAEESVAELKKYMLSTQNTNILDAYHFKDNSLGLPVDAVCDGDADRYLSCIAYFLGHKDEVLYTGDTTSDITADKYVVSLSSLVVLCLLDCLDILDEFADRIYIPESLLKFIDDRIASCGSTKINSAGSLVADNGNVFMIPDQSDKEIDIWEKIRSSCNHLQKTELETDEKINFRVNDQFYLEEFINMSHSLSVEMDFIVLSSKIRATYICDDLFFRNIASWGGIQNINSASLVYGMSDLSKQKKLVEKLSEVNYLCTSFIMSDDTEWNNRIIHNLITGNRYKNEYYRPIISRAVLSCRKEFSDVLKDTGVIFSNINNSAMTDRQIEEIEEIRKQSDDSVHKNAEEDPDCPPLT